MNIVFAGSDSFSVPSLRRLHHDWVVSLVLTAPARPAGRHQHMRATPVEEYCQEHAIPYSTPLSLKKESRELVLAYAPDMLVCVAYGRIFGPKFLALFPYGGINLHPSMLPRFRGATPMVATLLSGDTECGVTIQQLALKVDSGDILAQRSLPINPTTTIAELKTQCAQVGAQLLSHTIGQITEGKVRPIPQDETQSTYCVPLTKAHGAIAWSHSAGYIGAMVRAFQGWPRSYCYYAGRLLFIDHAQPLTPRQERTAIQQYFASHPEKRPKAHPPIPVGTIFAVTPYGLLVQTGKGVLAIRTLQLAGKNTTDFMSFARGYPSCVGSRLTSQC